VRRADGPAKVRNEVEQFSDSAAACSCTHYIFLHSPTFTDVGRGGRAAGSSGRKQTTADGRFRLKRSIDGPKSKVMESQPPARADLIGGCELNSNKERIWQRL
jgi:hypothetical protein